MNACPIFQAASAMKLIEAELVALVDELGDQLSKFHSPGLRIEPDWSWREDDSNWSTSWAVLDFPVRLKGTRQARFLSIRFDLSRASVRKDDWTHSSDALLISAFDPQPSGQWTPQQMAVRSDGRLADDDAWEACRTSIHRDRILEWRDASRGETWSQRSWLIATPLRMLSSPESLRDGLTAVIGGMLSDQPLDALPLDKLVAWAGTEAGSPARSVEWP